MKQSPNKDIWQWGAMLLISVIAAVLLLFSDYLPFSGTDPPQLQDSGVSFEDAELHGLYSVVRVVDGDTIVVDLDGTETKVRLIGVDTPESVHPDAARNTDEGKIAAEWTTELLTDRRVYLEYDTDRTDDYGRTLAYVWLEDGSMVQDRLLESGMATVMTVPPNRKYAVHFTFLENAARENGIGLWAN